MSGDTDVCSVWSEKFDGDLKSVVNCSVCAQCFHGKCEGVSDLRGFHKKKMWKSSGCTIKEVASSGSGDGSVKGRKRGKSDSDETIEIDRSCLRGLIIMVRILAESSEIIKSKLEVLSQQHKLLVDEVMNLKSQGQQKPPGYPNEEPLSFAQKVSGRLPKKVEKRAADNRNNKVFTFNATPSSPKIPPHSGPAQAILKAFQDHANSPSTSQENENNEFQPVKKTLKKRKSKPVVIGSREVHLGSSQENNIGSSLEGTERRHWIYVGRCKPKTTVEMVTNYVSTNWNIVDVKCFNLYDGDEIISFKVGVAESHIVDLLNATKWPKGVAVREFVKSKRQPRVGNFEPSGSPAGTDVDPPTSITGRQQVTDDRKDTNFTQPTQNSENR